MRTMNQFMTGLFSPNVRKRPSYLVMLRCPECGHLWESSRTGRPCPSCTNKNTIPAANWNPTKYGISKLAMGKGKINQSSVHGKGKGE